MTSCTITFAKTYNSVPICIVQTKSNASPVTYATSASKTLLTVGWNAAFNGGWYYICQDAS